MRIFATSTSSAGTGARYAITIAIALIALAGAAFAQAPAPPPGPPPLTQPSVPILPGAPSQLTSVPGVVATPLLTPVPVPTAMPTPGPRLFNCSCFTNASGTQWEGTVSASSYSGAQLAAIGACISYLTSTPQSPYIPPGQSPGLGELNTTAAGASGTSPSSSSSVTSSSSSSTGQTGGAGTSNSPAAALENSPIQTGSSACNVCACN